MTIFCYQTPAGAVDSVDLSRVAGIKLYNGVNKQLSDKFGEDFGIVFELDYNDDSFFLDCTGELNSSDYSYAVNLIKQVCTQEAALDKYQDALMAALQSDPRYKS